LHDLIWLQLIHELEIDAEQYVAEDFQRRIVAPKICPHCDRSDALWALGYYVRNLTRLRAGFLRIVIRRFRCRACGKTISILPSFAQPYRLVQNGTIEKFVGGRCDDPVVLRWMGLLRRYWRRFALWVPEMEYVMAGVANRSPPDEPREWWDLLLAHYGNLAKATQASVSVFKITFFGRYRCHFPNPPAV
jgi:hypothetical protein